MVFLESVTWFQNKFFIQELGQELLEPSLEIWELILSSNPADQVGLLEAGRQKVVAGWLPAEGTSLVGRVLVGHIVNNQGFKFFILRV